MAKASHGPYLNMSMSGAFPLPASETVRETAERLAQGELLKWPGSISIHGFIRPMPKTPRRSVERLHRAQRVLVYDVEWGKWEREWV